MTDVKEHHQLPIHYVSIDWDKASFKLRGLQGKVIVTKLLYMFLLLERHKRLHLDYWNSFQLIIWSVMVKPYHVTNLACVFYQYTVGPCTAGISMRVKLHRACCVHSGVIYRQYVPNSSYSRCDSAYGTCDR